MKPLDISYFPSSYHAAIFRLWETTSAERIANALESTLEDVLEAAEKMGLPKQKCSPEWEKRGYISIIKSVWHILPYEQILKLLNWSEEKFSNILKDEDFLYVKLGNVKHNLEPVRKPMLDAEGEKKLLRIREIVEKNFSDLFEGAEPFSFFKQNSDAEKIQIQSNSGIRMIYSYCGLYSNVLDEDILISYPEKLLEEYASVGINAIWLPVVLYQVVKFPFNEKYSAGYEARRENLRKLIKIASKYGIKVFLYLNEPRCMPLSFFEEHPELLGAKRDQYGALCSDRPEVEAYLREGVKELCEAVPGLGGFFTITCSEYLTHCKSNKEITPCPICEEKPTSLLVSNVLTAIYESATSVDPDIKVIAWTWAWESFMSNDEIDECINSLPEGIIIQTCSEAKKAFNVGGVEGVVDDYSMSIIGPSEFSKKVWDHSLNRGHEICAKVQVNVTWECSTLPFLPVFDLVREHMTNLNSEGVQHTMLSWTLGGCPSVNLKIATECLNDPSYEKYKELLKQEYGEFSEIVERAAHLFSNAFKEFPFHIRSLYFGPQNGGPVNPLYIESTELKATMTGFPYDDIDAWRVIYPRDVYINQFKKLSDEWKKGLKLLDTMPNNDFKQSALGGYLLFRSSYLQALFVDARDKGDKETMVCIAKEEKENAKDFYNLMKLNPYFGYEAANHYYFTKTQLIEKVLNCNNIIEKLS